MLLLPAHSVVSNVARWAAVDAVRGAHRIGKWATAIVAALKRNLKHYPSGQLLLKVTEDIISMYFFL